jgi:hypothetical protein
VESVRIENSSGQQLSNEEEVQLSKEVVQLSSQQCRQSVRKKTQAASGYQRRLSREVD